jgi:hypothetical protein
MEKLIKFCFQTAKVACDEKCNKAWGSERPRVYAGLGDQVFGYGFTEGVYPDNDHIDNDDYALLSDDELGEAPIDTGTTVGFEGKPQKGDSIPNKWCVNECERCVMSAPGKHDEPLKLPDFSKRRHNIYSKNV